MPQLPAELAEARLRAAGARSKRAPWGPDVDLDRYSPSPRKAPSAQGFDDALLEAGIEPTGKGRAGTYLQADRAVICRSVGKSWEGQAEILPIAEALEKRPGLADLWWKSVAPDADKYTARTALHPPEGYYIGIFPGARIEEPLQSCLLISRGGSMQCVHNIIVAGEGSEAHVIVGCTSPAAVGEGLHLGVTESLVRRGASLTLTMIHNWGPGFHVRPRSLTTVEEGGTCISNYVLMKPLQSLQMFPATILKGDGSRARFQSLITGRDRSVIDIGSRVVHVGDDTRSESISRVIASGHSVITARGRVEARTDRCRGHLECRGMIRSTEASIVAVPELDAQGAPHADLSHEAAISPIAEEEVSYLMARGIPREEAVATITRGFLDVDLLGLPPSLQRAVDRHLSMATEFSGSADSTGARSA